MSCSIRSVLIILVLATCFYRCADKNQEIVNKYSIELSPKWAQRVVWYQIFVERFRNGDPSNDPALNDIIGSWPHQQPKGWSITPWGHDWYKQENWAKKLNPDFYYTVQNRRYGGDLQGVLDKLDYLEALGITAIYFNPLNDSPSLHKYDARNYRHIDRNFGPNPEGDRELIASEDPVDPNSWYWTEADKLFLSLVKKIHDRGMKVIVDFSWNHTGIEFWAWKDVLKNQQNSSYADWYEIESFDDPSTEENEFKYHGWNGVFEMPALKKVEVVNRINGKPYEGNLHPEVKKHVFAVTKRWLDPNSDGDPSDGIDGFRLDVAEQIPLGFWRDYRKFVKGINPEAYLVGEIWWESWPNKLMDPRPYLQGDMFDAVMHYHWYEPTRKFFANADGGLSPSDYFSELDSLTANISPDKLYSMMNLGASHDTPRLLTSLFNKGKYKYQTHGSNPDYKIGKPYQSTVAELKLLTIQQFTMVGSPHIWNGDELGMWGADDPDCRKPIIWDDIDFENEIYNPDGSIREVPDTVRLNQEIYNHYQKLANIRNTYPVLQTGDLELIKADDELNVVIYKRSDSSAEVIIILNNSNLKQDIKAEGISDGSYLDLLSNNDTYEVVDRKLSINIKEKWGLILLKK